jgi:hypothetical protein
LSAALPLQVVQYVVTVLVALMAMQASVDRYWSLQSKTSMWQDLLFCLFITYPMLTLMLVIVTNNEMVIRRFMYYRMMSMQVSRQRAAAQTGAAVCGQEFVTVTTVVQLQHIVHPATSSYPAHFVNGFALQVIIDWENRSMFRMWFFVVSVLAILPCAFCELQAA